MKATLVNVRGTNGSGKTFLVRAWMKEVGATAYPRRPSLLGGTQPYKRTEYYELSDGGCVIGNYDSAVCAGCDLIKDVNKIRQIVKSKIHDHRYLLFEGIFISSSFQPWFDFVKVLGATMLWVFLDTPVEICTERILSRNHNKPIADVYKRKHRDIETIRKKAIAAGETVEVIHWQRAVPEFLQLMRGLE